nr:hypothetical protein GCM10020063_047370 [Dactylosporangium thailandense]
MSEYDVRKRLEAVLRSRAAEARAEHPLSPAQRSLLILHQTDPANAAYNVAFTARFTGGFDAAAFHGALRSLVGRHAALRTTFGRVGTPGAGAVEGRQSVHGWLEPGFAETDAGDWGDERLAETVRDDHREPFDLMSGPPIRARVYRTAPGAAVVLLSVHHIVCDFWSLGLMLAELEQLYRAESERRPANLPARNAPYTDFVTYQRDLIATARGERARAYWHGRLAGRLEPTAWPRFEPDPADADGGASIVFAFPDALARDVFALAREAGSTPYVVLLTAFQILIGRYTGRRDVLIGTPVAGRTDPALAESVGNFVNPVVLRAELDGAASFGELLERSRRTVAEALEHQDYPFERLVRELSPPRRDGRNPIFQAMFSYQQPHRYPAHAGLYVADEGATPVAWAGLTAVPFRLAQQDDQLELVLEVVHDGDRLVAVLKHRTSVFPSAAARQVIRCYLTLLGAAVANPRRRADDLPLPAVGDSGRVGDAVGAGDPAGDALADAAAPADEPAPTGLGAHERRVTAVWRQVLGREAIGPDDNFFDLGGNSMLLMQVHQLLTDEAADRPLTVPDLFRYPTVTSLARRIGQAAAPAGEGPGRGRASSRRLQLADGTARGARLRARGRQRVDGDGGRDA